MAHSGLKIAFIGCGQMGSAVLAGLLEATVKGEDSGAPDSEPSRRISTAIACTKTEGSARQLEQAFERYGPRVRVLHSQNVQAMKEADVVVLGCKPYMARDVLGAPGVREALAGKLVVSMLAGLTASEVRNLIDAREGQAPHVAKAIPNVAARYCQSMTILETPAGDGDALPQWAADLTEWIFDQVGRTKWLASDLVNAGSTLMTSCLATLSVPLEGLLDGSVAEGLRRPDAMELAVQGVLGLATVLANGTHPAVMRESISSPRGTTIQSLLTVEKAATRAVFAQALIDGVEHLRRMS